MTYPFGRRLALVLFSIIATLEANGTPTKDTSLERLDFVEVSFLPGGLIQGEFKAYRLIVLPSGETYIDLLDWSEDKGIFVTNKSPALFKRLLGILERHEFAKIPQESDCSTQVTDTAFYQLRLSNGGDNHLVTWDMGCKDRIDEERLETIVENLEEASDIKALISGLITAKEREHANHQ